MIPGSANPLLLATTAGAGGYEIERSLRFNTADSAHLSRTPSVAGNRKTWTWAGWVKKSQVTSGGDFFFIDGSSTPGEYFICNWYSEGLAITDYQYYYFRLADVNYYLRDPSAWYHIVIALDSTAATEASRLSVYINGNLISSAATKPTAVALNQEFGVNRASLHQIGRFNGLLADIHFIDSQALTPSAFGEFDTNGVWQPIEYTGTFGTNGFHLPFSDNSTAAALGTDTSSNGNTWTVNNLSVTAGAGNDSLVDSPTNGSQTDTGVGGEVVGNYATLNPIEKQSYYASQYTLSDGNLKSVQSTSYANHPSTIAMKSGKWYCEGRVDSLANAANQMYCGIIRTDAGLTAYGYFENLAPDLGSMFWGDNTGINRTFAYGASYAAIGTILGIAFDADLGSCTYYINGVSQGATTYSIVQGKEYYFGFGSYTAGGWSVNFGQRPFAYTAPSGFKALCTTNLAEPTIADGSTAMDVALYTGNGSTQTISGLEFSPDFVWIKERSSTSSHQLYDTIRGATNTLYSNLTNEEQVNANALTSFTSTGFNVGADNNVNQDTQTYAAWCWDAGSSTVTNTQGSITSQVRANPGAVFSVVTYTGNGAAGATVGHGLGVAPSMLLVKARAGVENWAAYHSSIGATKYLILNATSAEAVDIGRWNNTAPTSTVVSIGDHGSVNTNTTNYVAYCFAPVAGYSSFGSYTGNGLADGPFIYTGFRPRWVLVKNSSATGAWILLDSARDTYNVAGLTLTPDASTAESSNDSRWDFLSNGFKIRNTYSNQNSNGATYIYAAFAEHFFATARAR
jgi:hypothetical protein